MGMSAPTPSHTFEHLSCFLPGLLALGVRELDLDSINLDTVLAGSARRSGRVSARERDHFEMIKKHKSLKELHLWAAEGLAETCWLTYVDQPSGLGPDEVTFLLRGQRVPMKTKATTMESGRVGVKKDDDMGVAEWGWGSLWNWVWERGSGWRGDMNEERHAEGDGMSYLWIDAIEQWRGSGREGLPPGVGGRKGAVVYSEKDRLSGKGRGRDYAVRKSGYLLRPEVSCLVLQN